MKWYSSYLVAAFTLPNLLTYFRMGASFVLLYFGLRGRWEIAYPIFLAAAATDLVDGTLARILRQRTRLGAFLDPVADKMLMFASFLSLTLGGFLPVAITALVFTRDLLISIGLYILKKSGSTIVYQPTYLSKLTTLFQILTIVGGFWCASLKTKGLPPLEGWPYGTLWALVLGTTTLLTAVTAVQYLRIGLDLLASRPLPPDHGSP